MSEALPSTPVSPDRPSEKRTAVSLTAEQISKLRSLTLARMWRVAKLIDRWTWRTNGAVTDARKMKAQAHLDVYRAELSMLESTWSELKTAAQEGVSP